MFRLKKIINAKIDKTLNITADAGNRVTDTMYKGGLLSIILITIVWVSIFLYIAFYYAYMPSLMFSRPIHMQFK